MKIAISTNNKDFNSQISSQAAHAPYYLIVREGNLEEALLNPYANKERGLGPKVAKLLIDKKVDKVIVQQMGFNMRMFLEDNNVEVEETELKEVKDLIEKIK